MDDCCKERLVRGRARISRKRQGLLPAAEHKAAKSPSTLSRRGRVGSARRSRIDIDDHGIDQYHGSGGETTIRNHGPQFHHELGQRCWRRVKTGACTAIAGQDAFIRTSTTNTRPGAPSSPFPGLQPDGSRIARPSSGCVTAGTPLFGAPGLSHTGPVRVANIVQRAAGRLSVEAAVDPAAQRRPRPAITR